MARPSESIPVVLIICLVAALSACNGSTGGNDLPSASSSGAARVETTFTRIAAAGFIDLSIEFGNPTHKPVTFSGRLVARDEGCAELQDVGVTTAFGTESGRAVVMPGGSVDFVQLHRPNSKKVRDITLEDLTVAAADVTVSTEPIKLFPIDASGNELDYDMLAVRARLTNTNPIPVRVRVVLMVLRAPRTEARR